MVEQPNPKDETTGTSIQWETPIEKATFLLELLQGRFFILLFAYFLSTIIGMVVLLQLGYYLFWFGSFVFTVSVFMACESAFFLFIAYRTYKPLADISAWLDENLEVG